MMYGLKMRHLGLVAFSAVLCAWGLAADPLSAGTPSSAAASETLLLPGAANTVGTHATHWRSDLSLRNPGNDPIEVRVFFLRAGQQNELGGAPHRDYFLISGETKELHLPPLSSAQQTSPVRLAKGTARVTRVEGAGPYIAYATTVDNATGAATFAYAAPEPGQPAAVRPVSYASLAE